MPASMIGKYSADAVAESAAQGGGQGVGSLQAIDNWPHTWPWPPKQGWLPDPVRGLPNGVVMDNWGEGIVIGGGVAAEHADDPNMGPAATVANVDPDGMGLGALIPAGWQDWGGIYKLTESQTEHLAYARQLARTTGAEDGAQALAQLGLGNEYMPGSEYYDDPLTGGGGGVRGLGIRGLGGLGFAGAASGGAGSGYWKDLLADWSSFGTDFLTSKFGTARGTLTQTGPGGTELVYRQDIGGASPAVAAGGVFPSSSGFLSGAGSGVLLAVGLGVVVLLFAGRRK